MHTAVAKAVNKNIAVVKSVRDLAVVEALGRGDEEVSACVCVWMPGVCVRVCACVCCTWGEKKKKKSRTSPPTKYVHALYSVYLVLFLVLLYLLLYLVYLLGYLLSLLYYSRNARSPSLLAALLVFLVGTPTNFCLFFFLQVWVTFRRRSGLYRLRSAVVLGGGLSAEEMQWVERLCSGMGAAAINLANSRLLDRFCTDDIVLG
jgi:hypothetical protein